MFLLNTDYLAAIKNQVLEHILENDPTIRETAELQAQAEIEGYLAARYDTPAIFSATGTDRHPMVVRCMVDLSLYHLYARLSPDQVPELRAERYRQCIDWLKQTARQMINPNLPEPEDQTKEEVRYGSNPARGNRF